MNLKKILTGACAGALALSLAIPAFADLGTEYTATDNIGESVGTITVSTPAESGSLYINTAGAPYELKDVTSGGLTVKGSTVTDGFFTTPAVLVNKGEDELVVKVTVTSNVKNLEIKASLAGSETSNTIAGNLEVATVTANGTIVTPKWDTAEKFAIPAAADTSGTATDSASPTTGTVTAKLPGATEGQDPTTFAPITIPGCLAYRLAGKIALGDDGWDTSEAKVNVVFTLEPST